MNLNHLAYFRVLGNTEHYTKAANELNITQPSLSHAIRVLEEDLGTELFERQGRNVKLTKYGRIFHKTVEKALTELEAGERQLRSLTCQKGGQIDLAFIYTLGANFVPNLMSHFLKVHDHKEIPLSFSQGTTAEIIAGLKDKTYDIGFCSYVENEPDIIFTRVYYERLVILLPPDHPLSWKDSMDLIEIKDENLIYYNKLSGLRTTIDGMFEQIGVEPNIACEVVEENAAVGLVSIGYGVAIVPDSPLLDNFNVKRVPLTSSVLNRYVYMAMLKNHYLTPSVQKLHAYMLEHKLL